MGECTYMHACKRACVRVCVCMRVVLCSLYLSLAVNVTGNAEAAAATLDTNAKNTETAETMGELCVDKL